MNNVNVRGFMSHPIYQNLIGGEWVCAASGKTFLNLNPADSRDVIGEFSSSDAEDVARAVAAAKKAYATWRLVPAPKRAEILVRTGNLLVQHKERFAQDMTREMGKVLSVQTLGTAEQKYQNDVFHRRSQAVHLAYGEGILVLPTNTGAVFGFNLLENSLVWTYPYRENDDEPSDDMSNSVFPGGRRIIRPGVIFGPDGRPILPNANQNQWKTSAPATA